MTSNYSLHKRAVVLFPRTAYLSDEAVRHARRKWVRSVCILRNNGQSKWILDKPVVRKCEH